MLTRTSLQDLARMRLDDALLLAAHCRWSSAYYLSGYAVELGLKACAARIFQPDSIPDKRLVNAIYTHNLDELVSVAGLRPELRRSLSDDVVFASYWGVASQWNENSRYEEWDSVNANILLNAIANDESGVFRWVKKHW